MEAAIRARVEMVTRITHSFFCFRFKIITAIIYVNAAAQKYT